MSKNYDVIVIGAGPAGSTAARNLAKADRKVLLIDKEKFPRPKACGGGLTGNVKKYLDFDISPVIETKVTSTLCIFHGLISKKLSPAGLNVEMVKRPKFDLLLSQKAVESGCTFMDETALINFSRSNGTFSVSTTKGEFYSKAMIGADGAASRTARIAGLRKSFTHGIAMDAEVFQKEEIISKWKNTSLFDFGIVPRGYGWVFPKSDSFSIGVGTVNNKFIDARKHLNNLIERYVFLHNADKIVIRSAPIPYWEQKEILASDGLFLTGDAAGLVDPLSGEGISYAVRSGYYAAQYVNEFLAGKTSAEKEYNESIEKNITESFVYAKKLMSIFFKHPVLSYMLGVRSKVVNDIFAKLITGEINYIDVYNQIRRSAPGKIYRIIRPVFQI